MRNEHDTPETETMTKTTTFGKMIALDASLSEAEIYFGDDAVGSIVRDAYDAGHTSIEYRTAGYTVELDSDTGPGKFFRVARLERSWGRRGMVQVTGYETARKALAAAKAFARTTLNTGA